LASNFAISRSLLSSISHLLSSIFHRPPTRRTGKARRLFLKSHHIVQTMKIGMKITTGMKMTMAMLKHNSELSEICLLQFLLSLLSPPRTALRVYSSEREQHHRNRIRYQNAGQRLLHALLIHDVHTVMRGVAVARDHHHTIPRLRAKERTKTM
jgi:hypothetical protein